MIITLNEHEEAERYLSELILEGDTFRKLRIVARYFIDTGYGANKILKSKMSEFVAMCGEYPTLNFWNDLIDKAIKKARKTEAILINSVPVYSAEMGRINSLDSTQLRRLAFTLLCLARFRDMTSESNDHWVCMPDKEIMKLANIKTSLKRQAELYRKLSLAGFLKFPEKVDSISMQVLYMDETGDIATEIELFKNLGYQYLKLRGEPYFECENCGVTIKRKPGDKHHQKYCDQCAALMRAKQNTESVMRLRRLSAMGA